MKSKTLSNKASLKTLYKRAVAKSSGERTWYALAFALPFFILLIAYFSMGLYPFGERSPLSYDLNAQYSHFFVGLKNIFSDGGSLIYSWSRSLGGEFLGMIAYYLLSPFTILILLLPTACIETSIILVILLKTGSIGCTAFAYLRRSQGLKKETSLIFAISYALCSYCVVYGSNLMWLDELMILPLLTHGIERLIDTKKYGIYVFSLTYALICNYYIGYMLCIFTALYFFAYLFGQSADRKIKSGETDAFKPRRISAAFLRICIFSLISIAVAAFVLLPAYRSLTFGKTDFSVPDFTPKQTADFLEIVRKMFFGSYDTVNYDGLPFIYSGMLSLIFAAMYFVNKSFGIREKIANALILTVLFASTSITTLDLVWHGFQFPNCLNYRYSFIISFMICVIAAKCYDKRGNSPKLHTITACVLIVSTVICIQAQHYESENDLSYIWVSIVITAVYLIVLCAPNKPSFSKCTSVLISVLVCAEMLSASALSLKAYRADVKYVAHGTLQNYIAKYSGTVDDIYESDSDFYRIEKLGSKRVNDPFSLGFRGISGSTSTLNSAVIALLNDLGYGADSNFVNYLSPSPVTDSILSIKYLISDKSFQSGGYELVTDPSQASENDALVYSNTNWLPVAFPANGAVKNGDIKECDTPFEAINILASSLCGTTLRPYNALKLKVVQYGGTVAVNAAGHIGYIPANDDPREYYFVEFTAKATKGRPLYACFPTEYTSKATLYVNGEKITDVDSEDGKVIHLLGEYEGEVKIRLQWTEGDFWVKDGINFVYELNDSAVSEMYSTLSASNTVIEHQSDTKLTGTFTRTASNSVLFTSIPYDSDWSVYIDGKKVKTEKILDTLLSVDLDAEGIEVGEHTLTLKYSSSSFKLGACISLIGVTSLAAAYVFTDTDIIKKLSSKRRKD